MTSCIVAGASGSTRNIGARVGWGLECVLTSEFRLAGQRRSLVERCRSLSGMCAGAQQSGGRTRQTVGPAGCNRPIGNSLANPARLYLCLYQHGQRIGPYSRPRGEAIAKYGAELRLDPDVAAAISAR